MSRSYSILNMIVFIIVLLLPAVLCVDYEEDTIKVSCEDRCLRIHDRSLARIGFTKVKADSYIDKPKTNEKTLRDVCWKQYDYFYCMKGCVKSKEHEKHARHVKSRCKKAVEDLEPGLLCLFKYRSFLEIRCSSFLNEAIQLKQADDPDLLPDKETCRYLHLNALCLENSVSSFCPQATPFFRRLNFRDYFLNHILPTDDQLFDDEDLDACQMKDFVKEALEGVRVSPRKHEEDDEMTTPSLHATTPMVSASTFDDYDDDDDEDSEESQVPSTTRPPAIVRTLSPSTRGHSLIQTSTTSNFVYTTPARKQSSSTLVGTSTPPIHITKEQAIRTSTARAGEHRGQKITVTPKSQTTTTTPRTTTRDPSTTTSRRRLFDSDEDFSQTPPNFLWGSFRGENYKLARNYSESFPPNAQFVTPVTIESSSLFGDDDEDDSIYDDDGRPQVIDIDREPVTVTARPVELSTIVTLLDEKRAQTSSPRSDEDRSSAVYEHAVDTQLQPTTIRARPVPLGSAEATTVVNQRTESRALPTDYAVTRKQTTESWSTGSRVLPTDSYEDDGLPIDENQIRMLTEEEREESNRVNLHPISRVIDDIDEVTVKDDQVHRKAAENNFDRALQLDKNDDDDSNEIQRGILIDEPANPKPTPYSTTTPQPFTPLINGGRVAVKSIKQFKTIGDEESAQDWTEDTNFDDSHVDVGEIDDYDKETYLNTEVRPDESRDSEVRRRINFILAYTSLFFILLLLVVCCIIFVIIRNRKNASMDGPYKMHDSL